MKKGVQIIECLDDGDPGSEGRCLKHVFNLMEVESKYVRVETIVQLLKAIQRSKYKFIHISTHGSINDEDAFKGWWTPSGIGGEDTVARLSGKLECSAVVSTACKSGGSRFGRFVVDVLGSKYFIGPSGSPSFYDSAFFSHIFYHKLFKTRKDVVKAFKSYQRGYKNPHAFRLFKRQRSV
jgi:hypothetical protein